MNYEVRAAEPVNTTLQTHIAATEALKAENAELEASKGAYSTKMGEIIKSCIPNMTATEGEINKLVKLTYKAGDDAIIKRMRKLVFVVRKSEETVWRQAILGKRTEFQNHITSIYHNQDGGRDIATQMDTEADENAEHTEQVEVQLGNNSRSEAEKFVEWHAR
jgi:hypothetical protein